MSIKKLKFDLSADGFGVVTLDGNPIEVTSIRFQQSTGKPAEVTLTVFAEVEASIDVDEKTLKIEGNSK